MCFIWNLKIYFLKIAVGFSFKMWYIVFYKYCILWVQFPKKDWCILLAWTYWNHNLRVNCAEALLGLQNYIFVLKFIQ